MKTKKTKRSNRPQLTWICGDRDHCGHGDCYRRNTPAVGIVYCETPSNGGYYGLPMCLSHIRGFFGATVVNRRKSLLDKYRQWGLEAAPMPAAITDGDIPF